MNFHTQGGKTPLTGESFGIDYPRQWRSLFCCLGSGVSNNWLNSSTDLTWLTSSENNFRVFLRIFPDVFFTDF